ncbi:MAG: DNA recombination protein RmuC [Patescibacteria group bacterium]
MTLIFALFFVLGAVVIGLLSAVIFILLKKKPEAKGESALMLQQLNDTRQTMDKKLGEINQLLSAGLSASSNVMQGQLTQSAEIVREVTKQLTKVEETNKRVEGFAEQMQSLENILKNPKQRGNLGEFCLELLLEKSFTPKQYGKQYEFKNGEKVDFAIFIADKILPVDSKFSLENYNRIIDEKDETKKEQLEKIFKQDLKNRIDETAKYIRPQEGTFDFALMFIPAEGIYYDLMINEVGAMKSNTRDLVQYAAEKRVSIVSPNSFYAMLQTILQGLKAFHIEKSALEIRKHVEILGQHLVKFDEYMKKMGNNLSASVNAYNFAYKELAKIDKDVVKITDGERQIEPLQIDKPAISD